MHKGDTYYYTQAGIERSKAVASYAEALLDAQDAMQRHNPTVHIKKAVKGVRGSTVVATLHPRCYYMAQE